MPDRTRSNENESENSKPTDGDGENREGGKTNRPRADFYPRNAGISRGELYRNSREVEIDGEEWSVDTLVDLEQLRRERSGVWSRLMRSLDDEAEIAVVSGVLRPGPTGYDDLIERTGNGRTKVEEVVYSLRDAGVVTVEGRPADIAFVDDEVRLLASDVLSFLS